MTLRSGDFESPASAIPPLRQGDGDDKRKVLLPQPISGRLESFPPVSSLTYALVRSELQVGRRQQSLYLYLRTG